MSAEELENFETDLELQLYREYRDVAGLFQFVVETDRRFYLANSVRVEPVETKTGLYFDVELKDAWVWASSSTLTSLKLMTCTCFTKRAER